VTGGSFKYEISYRVKNPFKTFYVTIDEATEDLCHRASCPIKPGHVMFEYKKNIPPLLAPVRPLLKVEDEYDWVSRAFTKSRSKLRLALERPCFV